MKICRSGCGVCAVPASLCDEHAWLDQTCPLPELRGVGVEGKVMLSFAAGSGLL